MINEETAKLVVESFRAIAPQREALIESFYQQLFSTYPELQPFFEKVDKIALRRKLLLALITIIESLEDNELLYQSIQGIAATHERRQVQREHYIMFGKVLLETLADFLPEIWTKETGSAWEEALEQVTDMILKIGEYQQ